MLYRNNIYICNDTIFDLILLNYDNILRYYTLDGALKFGTLKLEEKIYPSIVISLSLNPQVKKY